MARFDNKYSLRTPAYADYLELPDFMEFNAVREAKGNPYSLETYGVEQKKGVTPSQNKLKTFISNFFNAQPEPFTSNQMKGFFQDPKFKKLEKRFKKDFKLLANAEKVGTMIDICSKQRQIENRLKEAEAIHILGKDIDPKDRDAEAIHILGVIHILGKDLEYAQNKYKEIHQLTLREAMEREFLKRNFSRIMKEAGFRDQDCRFHGTSFSATKQILQQQWIGSSVDRSKHGYATSDPPGFFSVSNLTNLQYTINNFSHMDTLSSANSGCIFMFQPAGNEYIFNRNQGVKASVQRDVLKGEIREAGEGETTLMENKKGLEGLLGVITTSDNMNDLLEIQQSIGMKNKIYDALDYCEFIENYTKEIARRQGAVFQEQGVGSPEQGDNEWDREY